VIFYGPDALPVCPYINIKKTIQLQHQKASSANAKTTVLQFLSETPKNQIPRNTFLFQCCCNANVNQIFM